MVTSRTSNDVVKTMVEKRWKGGGRADTESDGVRRHSSKLACLSTFAGNLSMILIGIFIATFLYEDRDLTQNYTASSEESSVTKLLGAKGALLYKSLDRNQDGNLSYSEFGPIVEKLTGEVPPVLVHERANAETGEAVTLLTDFEPLVFETMKTYQDEGVDGMMRNFQALTGLRGWTTAAMSEATFYSRDFYNLLPKSGDEEPGRVYWLYKPHLEPWHHGDSGRYFPPNPEATEEVLYRLMRMLHSQPFLLTRFGPHGSAAVVQGYNDKYYNIAFRIHSEFQVNEPPKLPFWVTPAQFKGNLIISKDGLSVKQFSLYLPSDRKLNVDMEWITKLADTDTGEGEQMEVEIAYQPKMAIFMSDGTSVDNFKWSKSIYENETAALLEKGFYPFKEVTYHPFEESFRHAAAENRLVHNIVLWGSLDDQSC